MEIKKPIPSDKEIYDRIISGYKSGNFGSIVEVAGILPKQWSKGQPLPHPPVSYLKTEDVGLLKRKCSAFLSFISTPISHQNPGSGLINSIIDCALHVCIIDQQVPSAKLKFILHDFWNTSEMKSEYASVDLNSTFDDGVSMNVNNATKQGNINQLTNPQNQINADWWNLLDTDTVAAIVGLTGVAFSLIRGGRKDIKHIKASYKENASFPSIPEKIGSFVSITSLPKRIEFAKDVLETIVNKFTRISSALQAVMSPALEFKRSQMKKKQKDVVADRYLNMLAMSSLHLLGMKPIKLIIDLAEIYQMTHADFMKSIAHSTIKPHLDKIMSFFEMNKSEREDRDPAADWARCIDHGYYMEMSAMNNADLYGLLVAIYHEAVPTTNIKNSPTSIKLALFIKRYEDIAKKFHLFQKNQNRI